jgi:protein-disulfide isomerase
MRERGLMLTVGLLLVVLAGTAKGQTPTCDKLAEEQKALATQLLGKEHPYDCCDDTIANCLKQKEVCLLAVRLAENICRRVSDGQDATRISRALSRRARSMLGRGKRAAIDLKDVPAIGASNAPVQLVEYACGRCPYCARITPKIYEAVTKGRLKGKARLHFKVFPIRGHEFSKEAGLGFMAAAALGGFWSFALYSYERFDLFCPAKQVEWAAHAGLDRHQFDGLLKDPALEQKLVTSKKEGIVNKVDATPTFFINGRKYFGDMDIEEMVDVVSEEYDRLLGKEYQQ